ncbi:MAG: hypothetical protein JW746_09305 [Candidatus Krumholzibacteriota bacterium]|nr:hypothetical protein [Candidatus Krumholzibacteriota bacterium]
MRSGSDPIDTGGILLRAGDGKEIVITGKVRLDLPEYRVRGSCRIFFDGEADMQVDFLHSSLFGSYREDATLYIDKEKIIIDDHERDLVWGSDRLTDALERHFGFPIYPGDIIVLLLLTEPELDGRSIAVDGDEWKAEGKWIGREAVIKGKKGRGPVEISLCGSDGTPCYIARYKYKEWSATGWYPEKIVLEQKYGSARFSFDINTVAPGMAGEAGEN